MAGWALIFLSFGVCALAAVAAHDFSRYQVILDKQPFGEITPSETALPTAALGEVVAKEIEMKSIIDDGTGVRVGLFDKKIKKHFSLGVKEVYEGLELVSVDYDNEEAVVVKGGESAVLKLRPNKDTGGPPAMASSADAGAPFQFPTPFAAAQSTPGARKPFFSDLKKRKMSPFQPMGTNDAPFQGKQLDSFFKVSTGAFPQAKSPFGPFPSSQQGAPPPIFQQFMRGGSNAANPFTQAFPPNPNARTDGRGATIDQLMQGQQQQDGQAPVLQPVIEVPADTEIPAE